MRELIKIRLCGKGSSWRLVLRGASKAMVSNETPTILESLDFARRIREISDEQRVELLHRLRQSTRLSYTVRGLNRLIEQPEHRPIAERALRTMGLDLPG